VSRIITLFTAALVVMGTPAVAQPVNDWFASLYTPEGVELRADQRIFDLYAVFNAMGYDEAPVSRRDPVPKREFNPVRQQVRMAAAAGLDEALRQKIDAFFDSHPVPAAKYVAYTLRLSAAPNFTPTADAGRDLAGLEGLLSAADAKLKLSDAFEKTQGDQRSMLKSYLKDIDGPLAAARKLLKLKDDDEDQRTVLALNLLEAPGAAESLWVDKEQVVVVGPSSKANVPAVVREYARLHVAPAVMRKASSYKFDVPPGVHGSTTDYVIETTVRAVALKTAVPSNAQDAELESLAKSGYGEVREMARTLDDFAKSDRSLDAYLAEAWPRVEATRKR
jgi:hypothetical protein